MFKQGFNNRKKWVELARSLDYTFDDVQKSYTEIASNLHTSNLLGKISYTLGHLTYWLLHEPLFLEDVEIAQLESDKERWKIEGRSLVDLSLIE
jgi:hypothetical protein